MRPLDVRVDSTVCLGRILALLRHAPEPSVIQADHGYGQDTRAPCQVGLKIHRVSATLVPPFSPMIGASTADTAPRPPRWTGHGVRTTQAVRLDSRLSCKAATPTFLFQDLGAILVFKGPESAWVHHTQQSVSQQPSGEVEGVLLPQ